VIGEVKSEVKTCLDLCHLTVVDGHIVSECETIEAGEELAKLLMNEVFIRVKPPKVTEQK
jgi:hypothetical protein